LNTRRFLDRLTAWSPALLLGGLAALTYWLDAQVQAPSNAGAGAPRHEPDMFIENFRAVSLGEDGKPRQILSAQRAVHYPDDQTSEFVEPRLKLDQPGKPGFELSAKHGKPSADHDQVWFSGNVRAVREPQPGESGAAASGGRMTLATEALHVATREERLDTDQPVTIEDARGIIRGVGLEFDNVARTASLRSQVSGTLQPGSTPRKGP